MAKRGAEDQKTRDDAPSDNEEDPGTRTEALKPIEGRKIRGMPKRKGLGGDAPPATSFSSAPASGFSFGASNGANAASAPTPAPPATSSGLGGFSFGEKPSAPAPPAAAPAPFSFGAPSAPAPARAPAANEKMDEEPAPKAAFGGFSFGGAKAPEKAADAAPKAAFGGFGFGKPSSTPTAAAVAASAAPSKEPARPAASDNRSSSGIGPSQSSPPNEGEVSYYTALRGLNASFVSFVSKSISSNEFMDLTAVLPSLLEQYSAHLAEAASKADWKPSNPPPTSAPAPKATEPAKKAPAPAPTPAPAAFSFSAPATKKPSAAVNAAVASVLADDEKKNEQEKEKESPAKSPQKFSFGAASKSGSLFSFAPSGPLVPTTPDSKTFSSSTTTPVDPPAKLGKFGPDGGAPQLSFGGAASSPAATSKGFSFGAPSSGAGFSFGSAGGEKTSEEEKKKDSSAFSFGKSTDKPAFSFSSSLPPTEKAADKPAFGGFGSSSGSGFSFGSTSTSDKPADKASFSFGSTPTPSTFSFSSSTPTTTAPASSTPTALAADAPADEEASKNLAEAEGAGEENEDTVAEQRGRLYVLEGGKFVVAGLGQLKLKREKEGGKRRLLMRADGSGAVVLNMGLQASFKPVAEDKKIKFPGIDLAGNLKPHMLAVKTKEAAAALVETMLKEVEALKAE